MASFLRSLLLLLCLLICYSVNNAREYKDIRLKVLTVASGESDGCQRFVRSAKVFNLDVEVIGLEDQSVADETQSEFGGYKMHVLYQSLEKYKDVEDLIVLFTENCEDSLFTTGEKEIVAKFKESDANILFSAEETCTPDSSLSGAYPVFTKHGYNYVSSSGMIGFAPVIYNMITAQMEKQTDDPQLYLTYIYLGHREKYDIKLDRVAKLFQNLNKQDVKLHFDGSNVRLTNTGFKTMPCVVHGNAKNNIYMNHIGNYLPKSWTHDDGCLACKEDLRYLGERKSWPRILIGLFVTSPTPFMDSFLLHISNLDYPKDKISVLIYNAEEYHNSEVKTWVKRFTGEYESLSYDGPDTFLNEQEARNMALVHCKRSKYDYYLSVDGIVTLSNRNTLKLLIEQNRPFLAPMLSKTDSYWSNFWGDVREDGFYARSPDYIEIVTNVRRGIWNVPFVNAAYLINSNVIEKLGVDPFYDNGSGDTDIEFCANNREKGVFMYVTNMERFGHIKEEKTFTTKQKHNDMYQVIKNKLDWEDKYLHPQYSYFLQKDSPTQEVCRDVFRVPMFTRNFTKALIEECEHYGKWSDGKNKDSRIAGGYENVPTVDIHMKQIDFENHWLYILKEYFAPMALRVYAGYYSRSSAYMNFVVKYTPSGQKLLRPHHDASTYTVNMALNEGGVDFEGGGARFTRYNCSVTDTKPGWAILNPGRLTHQHEGLETTNGTRYIMISFVDP